MKYKDSRLLYRCIKKHTHTNPAGVEGERAPPVVAGWQHKKRSSEMLQTTT